MKGGDYKLPRRSDASLHQGVTQMPIGITFVDTNTTTKAHPGGGSRVVTNVSADTKRSIRSHAARSAHARSRLERTAQYQAEIRDVERTDSNDGNSGTSTSTAATLPATAPSPKVALPLTRVPDVRGASFAAALAGLYASFSPFGDKAAVYISPFEQFLVDHFARWVVRYEVPHCSDGTSRERHGQLMLTRWMPLVLADRGALAALCLCACRSLALPATATAPTLSAAMQGLEQHQQLQLPYTRDQQQRRQQEQQNVTQSWTPQQQMYTRRALAYKAECIKSVNEAIARRGWRAGDTVIAQVLMLALDEVSCRSSSSTVTSLPRRTVVGTLPSAMADRSPSSDSGTLR